LLSRTRSPSEDLARRGWL